MPLPQQHPAPPRYSLPAAPLRPALAPVPLRPVIPPAPARPQLLPWPMTVLNHGLGADSVAITLALLEDPTGFGLRRDLSDLVVVTAMTGDEWPDTYALNEEHVLPALAARGVRYVQLARGGRRKRDGIVVLSDSRSTTQLVRRGPWTLSDELRTTGTVPNIAGGHKCSQKFKGEVLDEWARREFGPSGRFRRIIGYDATETPRQAKDTRYTAARNRRPEMPHCTPYYPLIELGWDRSRVERYIYERTGVHWPKSYCVMCPFPGVAASLPVHLRRCEEYPHNAAQALMLEHVAVSLNRYSLLLGSTSLLHELRTARAEQALAAFGQALAAGPWRIYQVRRLLTAKRDPDTGAVLPAKKGTGWRSVTAIHQTPDRASAERWLTRRADAEQLELHREPLTGITRAWVRKRGQFYPAVEEFLVAAPAHVEDKERPSFARQWEQATSDPNHDLALF